MTMDRPISAAKTKGSQRAGSLKSCAMMPYSAAVMAACTAEDPGRMLTGLPSADLRAR